MNIDQLPPEMLVIILKARKVSLQKYIQLRTVSRHWLTVIETHVLGKITELEINDNSIYGDRLPAPSTDEHTQLIARLLPAVTDLKIHLERVGSSNDQMPRLISLYSTTLTSLSLTFSHFKPIQCDAQWIQAINSLTKLSSLVLRSTNHPSMLPSLGPTLARLQRFTYRLERSSWYFTSDEPLVNLTDLHIEGHTFFPYTPFAARIVADIDTIFPSLQSLSLGEWFGTNLRDILRRLFSLERLSELELKIEVQKLRYEDDDEYEYVYEDDEIAERLMPSPTDRPLTGVKKLMLQFHDEFGEHDPAVPAAVLSLMAWFPNLTSLSIDNYHYEKFKLTDAVLGGLARLEHLTELRLPFCFWEEQFNGPTGRPLTIVTKLYLDFPDSDFKVEHFAPLVAWFPHLKDLSISLLSWRNGSSCSLTTAMLRDLSRLEHLSEFDLNGLNIKRDQLSLPSSTDRPLVNVKELTLELSPVYDSLKSTEEEDSLGERLVFLEYICEAIVAWFPNLTGLKSNVCEFENDKLALTNTMLRQFARLESLTWLYLETLVYKKEHLGLPSSTDRPLTSLKQLKLKIAGWPFDVPYFGQTLTAWFPCLEGLEIVADDKMKCSIEENRHYFGSSIKVTFCSL